jgi:hypothetical protein
MKNKNVQQAMKVATIAGAAVLVVNSAMKLTKAKDIKGAAMPLVAILVGVAAFKYAQSSAPVINA